MDWIFWLDVTDCPACLQTHRGTTMPTYVQVYTILLMFNHFAGYNMLTANSSQCSPHCLMRPQHMSAVSSLYCTGFCQLWYKATECHWISEICCKKIYWKCRQMKSGSGWFVVTASGNLSRTDYWSNAAFSWHMMRDKASGSHPAWSAAVQQENQRTDQQSASCPKYLTPGFPKHIFKLLVSGRAALLVGVCGPLSCKCVISDVRLKL